jgi:hypothetical protein
MTGRLLSFWGLKISKVGSDNIYRHGKIEKLPDDLFDPIDRDDTTRNESVTFDGVTLEMIQTDAFIPVVTSTEAASFSACLEHLY